MAGPETQQSLGAGDIKLPDADEIERLHDVYHEAKEEEIRQRSTELARQIVDEIESSSAGSHESGQAATVELEESDIPPGISADKWKEVLDLMDDPATLGFTDALRRASLGKNAVKRILRWRDGQGSLAMGDDDPEQAVSSSKVTEPSAVAPESLSGPPTPPFFENYKDRKTFESEIASLAVGWKRSGLSLDEYLASQPDSKALRYFRSYIESQPHE